MFLRNEHAYLLKNPHQFLAATFAAPSFEGDFVAAAGPCLRNASESTIPKTIDDNVLLFLAAPRTMARTRGISKYSIWRLTAYIINFSASASTNVAGLPANCARRSTGPLIGTPFG